MTFIFLFVLERMASYTRYPQHICMLCLKTRFHPVATYCGQFWLCLAWLLYRAYVRQGNIMMTSSNWNIFRVTGHLCGEFTGPRWIPLTKTSDAELWCFFDLRLNKRISKQSWGWWFETQARPLWRHCNDNWNDHECPIIYWWVSLLKWYTRNIQGF